jgi:hypothetical protein
MFSTETWKSLQQIATVGGGREGGRPHGFQGSALNTSHDFIDHNYEISMKISLD